MKEVAALVSLLLLLGSVEGAPQALWPGCESAPASNQAYIVPSTGGTYEALNCRYSISAIYAQNAKSVTTIAIIGGTVAAGPTSCFSLQLPTNTQVGSSGPLHVLISNVSFLRDAILVVLGSLPARSSLTVVNNTFDLLSLNANSGLAGPNAVIAAIIVGYFNSPPLLLANSSTWRIESNTIVVGATESNANGVLLASTAISVSDQSTFRIANNVMRNLTVLGNTHAVWWCALGDLSLTVLSSSFELTGNMCVDSTPKGNVYAVKVSTTGRMELNITHGSNVSVSGNSVLRATGLSSNTVVSLDAATEFSIFASNSSALDINNNTANTVDGTQSITTVLIKASTSTLAITLSYNSIMRVCYNSLQRISQVDPGSSIVAVRIEAATRVDVTASNSSYFEVNDNEISSSRGATFATVQVTAGPMSFNLADSSALTMSGNRMAGLKAVNSATVVSLIAQSTITFTVMRLSKVSFNRNAIINASLGPHGMAVSLLSSASSLLLISSSGSAISMCSNSIQSTTSILHIFVVSYSTKAGALDMVFNVGSTLSVGHNSALNVSSGIVNCVSWNANTNISLLAIGLSAVNISNNSISNSSLSGESSVVVLSLPNGYLALSSIAESAVSVSSNTVSRVSTSGVSSTHAVRLYANEILVRAVAQSEVLFDGNGMVSSVLEGPIFSVYWYGKETRVTVVSGSVVSLSGNSILNSTTSNGAIVVQLRTLQGVTLLCEGFSSRIRISSNSLSNTSLTETSSVVNFRTSSTDVSVNASGGAHIFIAGNNVDNTSCQNDLYAIRFDVAQFLTLVAVDQGGVAIADNTIRNLFAVGGSVIVLFLSSSNKAVTVQASQGSSITVSNNSIAKLKNGFILYAIYLRMPSLRFDISGNSTVSISRNRMQAVQSFQPVLIASVIYMDSDSTEVLALAGSAFNVHHNSVIESTAKLVLMYWSATLRFQFLANTSSIFSFTSNSIQHLVPPAGTATSMIYFALSIGSFVAIASSSISMNGNAVYDVENNVADVYCVWIVASQTLTFNVSENSLFSTSGNTIKRVNSRAAYVMYFSGYNFTLSIRGYSSMRIDSNSIANTTALIANVIEWEGLTGIQVDNRSAITANTNAVTNVRVLSNPMHVMHLHTPTGLCDISVTSYSTFQVAGTVIANTTALPAYLATTTAILFMVRIENINTMTVNNNSTFVISDNILRDVVTTVAWPIVIETVGYINIGGDSIVSVEGCTVRQSVKARSIQLAQFTSAGISLMRNSSFLIQNNTVDFSNVSSASTMLSIASSVANVQAQLMATDPGSAFVIDKNSLTSTANMSPSIALFDWDNFFIQLRVGSTVTVSSNRIMTYLYLDLPAIVLPIIIVAGAQTRVNISNNEVLMTGEAGFICPQSAINIPVVAANAASGSISINSNQLTWANASSSRLTECPMVHIGQSTLTLSISRNDMSSDGPLPYLSLGTIGIPINETMSINSNRARWQAAIDDEGHTAFVKVGTLMLQDQAALYVEENTFSSAVAFVSASAFSNGTGATVLACGNLFSNAQSDVRLTGLVNSLFWPVNLANKVTRCVTPTARLSSSRTLWTTGTQVATASMTNPMTHSSTDTATRVSPSPGQTLSTSRDDNMSMSDTLLLGLSTSIHPITLSRTRSSSLPHTASQDRTESIRSDSLLCKDLDLSPDRCHGMAAALAVPKAPSSSNCSFIAVPFGVWGGRNGDTHEIRLLSPDPRVSLRAGSAVHIRGSDVTLDAMTFLSAALTAESPLVPAVALTIRYTGKTTLSKLQYTIDWSALPLCPLAGDSVAEVSLLGSERLLPVPVAEVVSAGTGVVSVMGSVTASPTAVAQVAVLLSLRKMSRCEAPDLGDDDDPSVSELTSGILNPFQLGIGNGGARRLVRGALVTSVAYLIILSLLMFCYTAVSAHLASRFSPTRKRSITTRKLLDGYPSVLVAAISFAVDGSAGAGTVLIQNGQGGQDRAIGALALALCGLFVGHIVFVTTEVPPRPMGDG